MIMHEQVKHIKELYPVGSRVVLDWMDDPYSKLIPGDMGTVERIDDAGTIHVRWDMGSGLGLIPGVDSFHIMKG